MIAPRDRLLAWFGLVVIPTAALAGVLPEFAPACLAVAGLFLLAVSFDALVSLGALDGITVEAPSVTRLAMRSDGQIDLRIRNTLAAPRALRIAVPMPEALEAGADETSAALPASECSLLPWRCRALRRGDYALTEARVEAPSRLGFWNIRRRLPLAGRIRVYPDIRTMHRALTLMFRGSTGAHAQRLVGRGREFEKLREYVPGDGSEDIHWKATARKRFPVTKVYQVERTQEVYVAIDCSRLSARDEALETHLNTALILGLAAENQGDHFGLIAFSDRVERFVRARSGPSHFQACRDAIHALEPRPVNPDFEDACSFIRLHLRRRALVIFLTALDDPLLGENFLVAARLVARQHLVIAGMVNPSGLAPVFSRPPEESDTLHGQLARHLRWRHLEELRLQLQRLGVTFATWDREQVALRLVSEYLNLKRRQIL